MEAEIPAARLDIHEALARSADKIERAKTQVYSVRLYPATRDRASQICKQNGSDITAFIRECVDMLVEDYGGVAETEET